MQEIDLTDINQFKLFTEVSLRFSDQDPLSHINNVAYAAYIEQARVDAMVRLVKEQGYADIDCVLANVNINYLKEMHFPGTIQVGACLLRLGNKSITTGYGLFKDGVCHATATSVNVLIDGESRQSVAIPDDLRARIEANPI